MELLKTILKIISNLKLFNSEHVDIYMAENVSNNKPVSDVIEELGVKFKDESLRLQQEYKSLQKENKDLYDIVEDLNNFTQKSFKKRVTVTMIFRTQEEQEYLYRDDARFKKRKFKSPHQFWHAIDIRSRNFSEVEITKMVNYLNLNDTRNYYRWTSQNHSVGHGMHFHIQFIKK